MGDKFEEIYAAEFELLRELDEENAARLPTDVGRGEKRCHDEKRVDNSMCKKIKVDERNKEEKGKVYKRIPPGNFVAVTSSETKKRVYLRLRSGKCLIWNNRFDATTINELVSTPFPILRQQAEGINRNLLLWLRMWDKIVFGREFHITKRKEDIEWKKKKFFNQVIEELDSSGCPVQRITLLCGPPGLGKTTLAHIIANHAGYNVVELNASDDRSPEQFRSQIETSTQMKSVVDPRPNCLVIDEIDGAPAASINLLVSMATERKDKGKNTHIGLRRPVICICNDQYVAALRVLRQSALILSFPPIATTRLATRLQQILNVEKYFLDVTSILALCKKAENDVRSCLATLQFACKKGVTLSSLLSTGIGVKDRSKSHFAVWQEIFQNTTTSGLDTSFHRIVGSAQSNGNYERIYQGIFDNYLSMKNKNWSCVVDAGEWLTFVDIIEKEMRQLVNFNLYPYLPLSCVFFHRHFTMANNVKIEYTVIQTEVRNKVNQAHNILSQLTNDQPPLQRSMNTLNIDILEILPYLSVLLTPQLRPVNIRLLSMKERQELSNVLNLMISRNLNYVGKKSLEGQYTLELQPDIYQLVQFKQQQQPQALTYATKQLIAREIELEKVRRVEKSDIRSKSVNEMPTEKNSNLGEQFFAAPSIKKNQVDKSDVWFRYKEGYSNAVRRNVRVADLL